MTAALVSFLVLGLQDIDHAVYEDIRYGWQGPGLRFVSTLVSEVAGPPAQLGLAGVMYLRGNISQQRASRLAGAAWFSAMAVTTGINALIRRPRPEAASSSWWDSSFPSDHAAGYFAATTVYSRRWPELAPFAGLGGLLMCLSRVHLGRHYPSDVIAGAAVGYGCATATLSLEKRLTPILDRLAPLRGAMLDVRPGRLGLRCGI